MKTPAFPWAALAAAGLLTLGAPVWAASPTGAAVPAADGLYAVVSVDQGDIVLALELEKTPLTVSNFVALAEGTMTGQPFYNGLTFHRVIANFMAQGGDPTGNGTGGPGYQFADELDPSLKFTGPGILAMANSGPGTNGSQFFITTAKTDWLNGKHTIFGRVVAGQPAVNALKNGSVIRQVTIVRRGAAAEAFHPTKETFLALAASITQKKAQATADGLARYTEGTTTTASGLQFRVLKEGSGAQPARGQTLTVAYIGRLPDGTVFDSSYDRPAAFQFELGAGRVIPAWDEALAAMHVGEKRLLVVPPNLGYGNRAVGPIPAGSWLIFEVELKGIRG